MSSLANSAFIMMLTTIFAKVFGFARDIVMAWAFGAGMESDAIKIAQSIPTVLFGGIATSLLTCYIPMYNQIKKKGIKEVVKFNSNMISVVLLFTIILAVLFAIFSGSLVRIFAVGFQGAQYDMAVRQSRIMVFSMIFLGVAYILQGYIQAHEKYAVVGLMSVPMNIVFIIGVLLTVATGRYDILAIFTVLSFAVYIPYFGIAAKREGFIYRPYLNLRDPNVSKIIKLVIPVFLGRMVFDINNVINNTLASSLDVGTVSALDYAKRLENVIIGIFVISITTVIFPRISRLVQEKNTLQIRNTVTEGMNNMSLLIIPITVLMMVLATPIVQVMFQRGQFDAVATKKTAEALIYYMIGLTPMSYRLILEKVFYAVQDTKTPMQNSVIAIMINIVLSLILVNFMQHRGLALASSLASTISCILFYYNLKRKVGYTPGAAFRTDTIKILISSLIMGACALPLYRIADYYMKEGNFYRLMSLGFTGIICLIIYAICLRVFGVNALSGLQTILDRFKNTKRKVK